MIDEAASRRSSSISRRVRSTAPRAPAANFSHASVRDVASISKTRGMRPAGVSICASPT